MRPSDILAGAVVAFAAVASAQIVRSSVSCPKNLLTGTSDAFRAAQCAPTRVLTAAVTLSSASSTATGYARHRIFWFRYAR